MVSKNNKVKKFEQSAQRNNHFSIRKLTVGAASVLLGTSLYLGTQTSQAHAAEVAEVKDNEKVTAVATNKVDTDQPDAAETTAQPSVNITSTPSETSTKLDKATQSTNDKSTKDVAQSKTSNDDNAVAAAKAVQSNNDEDKTSTNKATEKQSYQVNISFWDDVTNAPLTYTGKLPATNGSFNQEVKVSDPVGILGMAPTGYKLLNPEAITSNFKMKGNVAYLDGHDVDITLHYAPLSPVYVEYVNEENGKVLSTTGVGSNTSSSQSIANAAGDVMYPGTSKFLVHAIDIPGYELVSDPEYIGYYDQVQSANNSNPIIVQFKYKKITNNEDPKDVKAGAEVDGQWFGPTWEPLPGGVSATGIYGVTYEEENGDIEAKYQAMIDRYQKQGYSYVGTFNYHKNSDYFNFNEAGISVDLIPNKPVTAYYVDENGNQIADPTVIAQNPNNPDQTNNGVNDADHWHPEGHWSVEAKDIPGYVLTKTYGATSGSFVPYEYNVTFVYTKKETKVPTTPPVDNKEVAGAVLYIDDTLPKDKQILSSDTFTGKVGQKIDYSTAATIKDYENQGYKLVSSDYKDGDETFTNDSNVFKVIFTHGIVPVNPNNPGKPGQPLNPDDPNGNGPKYPDGTSKDELEKKVTRTITYVGAGDKTPKEVVQSVNFTASGELDKVTGKWIKELTWTPDKGTLASVTTPVIEGYHVVSVSADSKDGVNVDSITVTRKNTDSKVVVIYAENGHIIPVDPNGHKIPNAPTPQYPTDPTNPSKVTPNEPVPEIPGYIPNTPTVTPENPGKDTDVTYTKKETATVPPLVENQPEAAIDTIKYIDDYTGKTMSEVKVGGAVGSKVTYTTTATIADYEAQGYKFVSSNFENGKEVYVKGGQTFEVHFTKGNEPVVPTTPTTPTDPNPTPEPHPEPNPDTDVPDIPAPEVPSVDVPMPHPQTPEVPEEPDETPAPHATTPETPVSEDEGEVPVVHASDNEDVPMPHAAQEALPQTGEKTSVMAVIAGAFASVLGIFGLANRKKEDK